MLNCKHMYIMKLRMYVLQDAVYGEGQDDDIKPKVAASRKRKTAEEEQNIKEEASAIDFKVKSSATCKQRHLMLAPQRFHVISMGLGPAPLSGMRVQPCSNLALSSQGNPVAWHNALLSTISLHAAAGDGCQRQTQQADCQ